MRFVASGDETMLRESARRALAAPGTGWIQAVELGWPMAALPESAGGLGMGARAAAILAEELGFAGSDIPYVEGTAAAQALFALGDARTEQVAAGTLFAVLAHNEMGARGAPDWIETRAATDGDGFRLSGVKHAIVGTEAADLLLVSAHVGGAGPSLFALPPGAVTVRSYRLFDGRTASDVMIDDVLVPATALVGTAGAAMPAIAAAFDHLLVLASAKALGTMQQAFDLTRTYLMTRQQYGKVIGTFQALQHRLADMFIQLEQARSMVAAGTDALEQPDVAHRMRLAAATKARVAQAGRYVTAQAIQLHGGIGVTEEYPVGMLFKRIVAFDQQHGPADVHVERFAGLA